MGMNWAEHSVEIEAPIETCFEAIVDYESFPSWQNAIDSIAVKTRTPDGLGEDVQLFVDAKVRKIDYTLRYRYARPTASVGLRHRQRDEGHGRLLRLHRAGARRTRARYNLGADADLPIPGIVVRRTHRSLVKRSVEDLKREAERRFAVAGSAPRGAGPGPGSARPARALRSARRSRRWRPRAASGGNRRGAMAAQGRTGRSRRPPRAGGINRRRAGRRGRAKGFEVAGRRCADGSRRRRASDEAGLRVAEEIAARVERLADRRCR